jgi:hypothetical protein
MRHKGHIMKTPKLNIELLECGGSTNHHNPHIMRTHLAHQSTRVQQSLIGVEVKFNAGHGHELRLLKARIKTFSQHGLWI